jgi:[CysO sulfur-carrier protein]-S-L-cysteine hydrolase
MSFRLLLPAQLRDEMVAQARAELPNECCGLLAGRVEGGVGQVERRYPLVNAAASPVEYDATPRSLLDAFRDMRRRGLTELALYHSHPTSDPVPSRKDLERNFYGEAVVHFIISLKGGEAVVRGWRLGAETFREAEWEVTGEAG